MTQDRERCADGCVRRGDPAGASAPPVNHWLLVEQPGPWGQDPWRESALPLHVVAAIAAQAAAAHARVLLIRRPGRSVPGVRRWAYVDSRPGHERAWWTTFTDPDELLDLRLTEGEPSTDPIYLVCAHGKHDTCCAIRGRPVAAALAKARPDQTWECSHVGGDRFAANVVVLPHGLYYGQVAAAHGPVIAERYEAGLVDVAHLRGRSTYSAPAQAAQQFARERVGEARLDAFPPLSARRVGHEQWEVELGTPTGPLRVEVRAVFQRSDTPLTCTATTPAAIRHFELVRWPDRAPG
ncbi:sucrase ferredoxin [Actinokineospora sp. NBRC 105648]|uniref:sucrase ferredoxin n=1 Tax=Actinokineospora sp. NBRC 105648 TaxID=3032206 RepID=UPI0024A0CAE2|nr:sucrase ferredoxin [Actinokineospora sp. NBRC 105648]GLZ36403.1 sucrase ferredoxin [Actinokineospora sp. NBRC 105648]